MKYLNDLYWNDPALLSLAIVALVFALVSTIADRRRQKRKRADDVGFMPWTTISLLSIVIALLATAMALKGG